MQAFSVLINTDILLLRMGYLHRFMMEMMSLMQKTVIHTFFIGCKDRMFLAIRQMEKCKNIKVKLLKLNHLNKSSTRSTN